MQRLRPKLMTVTAVLASLVPIPISARHGDNISGASEHTPWYHGPSLMQHLETVDVGDAKGDVVLRAMNVSPTDYLQTETRKTTMEALFEDYEKYRRNAGTTAGDSTGGQTHV